MANSKKSKPEEGKVDMVKVKVTWNIDYPVDVKDETYKFDAKGLTIQEVFDGLTMYIIKWHIRDASHWLVKSGCDKNTNEYRIYQQHNLWYDYLNKSEISNHIKYNITLPEEGKNEAKVEVIWDFEIPLTADDVLYEHNPVGIVKQLVFDEVTNYAICHHLEEACDWLSKSKENKKSVEYRLYRHHKDWADLLLKFREKVTCEVTLP